MEGIINRAIYIQKIEPFIGKQLIKVLVGARRVGKTAMLFQLMDIIKEKDPNSNIVYINKEYYEFKSIQNDEHLFQYVNERLQKNKKNYIFIDEVQEIENFEIALRQLFVQEHDLYCTGSNARMLSSDLATHLSGRYIEFQINSLNYREFLSFHGLINSTPNLLKFIKFGGLPYLKNLELTDEIVYGYLRSVFNTIILKDVVSRYKIRDFDFLERLIDYLSDNLGSYISSKKISDFIKSQGISLSVNTIMNYLSHLCSSFFLQKAERYDIQGKKVFEINEKYFFSDLGLKHSIIPYKANDISKVLENLVFNQLISMGYKVHIGKLQNLEIDFVAMKNEEIIYIQVAHRIESENVFEREFGNLLKIEDNYRKIVVSNDEFIEGNYKGIEHIQIKDFLISEF